jgi:hypothetical protein
MDDDSGAAQRSESAEIVRLRSELATLQARVSVLDWAVRLQRVFGPILLLVLAAVSPLLARHEEDFDATYTFVDIIKSSRGTTWTTVALVLIGLGWAFCVLGSLLLLSATGSRGEYLAVSVPAAALLLGLLVMIVTGGGWGRGASVYNGLQIGTVLAAGAAIWLIICSVSLGSAGGQGSRWASTG